MQHAATPTERSFAFSVGTACVVFAGLAWWREYPNVSAVLASVGGTLLFLGFVAPGTLHVPNLLWWRFAQVLGWVNSRIILSAFFFLVLTPVGLAMRLFGRNPLSQKDPRSGWSSYPVRQASPRHFERMF